MSKSIKLKKLSLKQKNEIREMAKNNEHYWYECSGRHEFRSWFLGIKAQPTCPEGHQMKIEKKAIWYVIANDIIEYLENYE